MPSVLITGASGFIGSILVEEALKHNFSVYAGVRKSSSRKYLPVSRITIIEFDFSTVETVTASLEKYRGPVGKFDYIIHCAGATKAKRKGDLMLVNLGYTCNFIEALKQAGMVPRKFVLISSLAAYGPGNPDTMKPVLLADAPQPVDLYGQSKLQAERFLKAQMDFPWLILRPTGVYGPRDREYLNYFKLLNLGLEFYIGSARQVLTFIHVNDLVRVIIQSLESPVVFRDYFVTDGNEYTSGEFAAIIKKHLKKRTIRLTVPVRFVKYLAVFWEKICSFGSRVPTFNQDKARIIASKNWRCETESFFRDFNFHPDYKLDEGVKKTLEWYWQEGWLKK